MIPDVTKYRRIGIGDTDVCVLNYAMYNVHIKFGSRFPNMKECTFGTLPQT